MKTKTALYLLALACVALVGFSVSSCNNMSVTEYNLFVYNSMTDTVVIKKIAPSGKSLTFKQMAPGDTCQIAHYTPIDDGPIETIYLDSKLIFTFNSGESYQTNKSDTLGPCWVKNYKPVGRSIYHFYLTDEYISTLR